MKYFTNSIITFIALFANVFAFNVLSQNYEVKFTVEGSATCNEAVVVNDFLFSPSQYIVLDHKQIKVDTLNANIQITYEVFFKVMPTNIIISPKDTVFAGSTMINDFLPQNWQYHPKLHDWAISVLYISNNDTIAKLVKTNQDLYSDCFMVDELCNKLSVIKHSISTDCPKQTHNSSKRIIKKNDSLLIHFIDTIGNPIQICTKPFLLNYLIKDTAIISDFETDLEYKIFVSNDLWQHVVCVTSPCYPIPHKSRFLNKYVGQYNRMKLCNKTQFDEYLSKGSGLCDEKVLVFNRLGNYLKMGRMVKTKKVSHNPDNMKITIEYIFEPSNTYQNNIDTTDISDLVKFDPKTTINQPIYHVEFVYNIAPWILPDTQKLIINVYKPCYAKMFNCDSIQIVKKSLKRICSFPYEQITKFHIENDSILHVYFKDSITNTIPIVCLAVGFKIDESRFTFTKPKPQKYHIFGHILNQENILYVDIDTVQINDLGTVDLSGCVVQENNDNLVNNDLEIFPNPFNSSFVTHGEMNEIILYDLLGNSVKLNSNSNNEFETDILRPGIYFIKTANGNKLKIIKE